VIEVEDIQGVFAASRLVERRINFQNSPGLNLVKQQDARNGSSINLCVCSQLDWILAPLQKEAS